MFHGSRIQQTFSRGSQRENYENAREWIVNRERQLTGLPRRAPRSLKEVVLNYLDGAGGSVKPNTWDQYNRMLSSVLRGMQSDSPMLEQSEINQYVSARRAEGAGRVIAKELSSLRSALKYNSIPVLWQTPGSLSRIPRQVRAVPTDGDVRSLMRDLSPHSRSALLLALLAGLRDAEVYRVEHGHYSQAEGTLSIPADIRKTGIGNIVPVVASLSGAIGGFGKNPEGSTIITTCKSHVKSELMKASAGFAHPWYGFQPARRALVTWAEDAGFTQDTIALVTGHARTDIVSRYSAEYGRLELERSVIESVERRLNA